MARKTKKICKRVAVSLLGFTAFLASFLMRFPSRISDSNHAAKSEKSADAARNSSVIPSANADYPSSSCASCSSGTADGSSGDGGDGDGA